MSRRLILVSISLGLSLAASALTIGCLYVFSSPQARLRYDLSTDQTNGVSDRVLKAFAGINQPVKLTAFLYSEDDNLLSFNSNVYMRAHDRLRLLIDDLSARAGSNFSSLIVDSNSPLVEQQRLQQLYQRQLGEVVVLSTADNHVVLQFDDMFEVSQAVVDKKMPSRLRHERVDAALGDAARRLSNADPFEIAVVKSVADDSKLQPFLEFLEREGHQVEHLQSFAQVAEHDLVIIPGQTVLMLPADLAAAENWVADDKRLFLALGAFAPDEIVAQWNEILSERGEGFAEGLLCEAIPIAGALMEGRAECAVLEINAGQISGQHKINFPLIRAQRSLLFAGTRPVLFGNTTNKYSQSRLLRTSPNAWIDNPMTGSQFARDISEKSTIYPIAVVSSAWGDKPSLRAGRLMLIGSDEVMGGHLAFNKDWLATSIMFLLGDELEKTGLRSISELPFHPSRDSLVTIKAISLYLLPGICFLLSIIIWLRRK